jgi:hypothetical protein
MLSKREWLVMYLCEGFKSLKPWIIGMANTDGQIIEWFIEGLEIYYGLSRSKLYLRLKLWIGMNEELEHKYWSERLGIPYENYFNPTWVPKSKRFKENKHGIITVKRGSKDVLLKVLSDLEQLKS